MQLINIQIMSNRAKRNKNSCLLCCEILYSLIGPCRPFKGSYCLGKKSSLNLGVYLPNNTASNVRRHGSSYSPPRQNLVTSPTWISFLFIFLYSLISFFSAFFLSTVFLLSSTANSWKLVSSVQFTFLILH